MGVFEVGPSLARRFWAGIAMGGPDECWVWTRARHKKGYGLIQDGYHCRRVSHVSLILAGHPRPYSSAIALHSCDNPPCGNPKHLRWGTIAENNQDAAAKGRCSDRAGVRNYISKLNDEAVRYIRSSPDSARSLGLLFGVRTATIKRVRSFSTWGHVE